MNRASAVRTVASAAVMILVPAAGPPATAQTWNDARTTALVDRATARRAMQIADTALAGYTASATGYLTFLGQFGEGMHAPPVVVRTDQIALQVYWRAPNLSKQVIVGRRDTMLLPADLRYHRDHLGIVQNNFPDVIRLGDGDEVKDVPHPLSKYGLTQYDFAISDSLRIRFPDRTVYVYEVKVRPKDATLPSFVGSLYLDTASAQVVRMAFSFTHAAYLDAQLEDISIVLENALVQQRFWLPFRQEVEIRRTGRFMDFPARGIIRGRWEICCYDVEIAPPPRIFIGPEIVEAPVRVQAQYPWKGGILDSLPPDVRIVTDAEVQRVQDEVAATVTARALAPREGAALYARRLSDLVRVNRVEGLALGAGGAWHAAPALDLALLARYGFADHAVKARASVGWRLGEDRSLTPFVERAYRDASDVAERSLPVNSVASQEYGSDFTDPYDVRAVGLHAGLGAWLGARWGATGSYERQGALAVHAVPFTDAYEPTLPAWPLEEWRVTLGVARDWSLGGGADLRVNGVVTGGALALRDTTIAGAPASFGRAFMEGEVKVPLGRQRLVFRTTVGAVTPDGAPPQEQVLLGGPITGPGYAYHQFAAAFGASQRVEWRVPLPFWRVPIGAFGRTPASFTLEPYAHTVYVNGMAPFAAPGEGWYPSLGIGASFFFDLVRIDVARGLRGGSWTFGLDIAHDLWSIL
jgi:hypothetical protein